MSNADAIRIEGKVAHIPHLGVSLRAINKVAHTALLQSGGSRYYEIKCNDKHVGRIAVTGQNT